jgi:hypothetical protein
MREAMSILKIKAKLYQWTGIYLADSEELDYIKSKEFWRAFKKIKRLNDRDKQGLLIGLWQYKHGFYR